MSFTNLVLGHNWDSGEWPEYVLVSHEGAADDVRYAPERTCHDLGGEDGTNYEYYDFGCSECGFVCDVPDPYYCPGCGARVIEGES